MTVDRRSRRALFVGGPADGNVESDHVPPDDGLVTVPQFRPGDLDAAVAGEWKPSEDDRWDEVTYVGRTIRDLDGKLLTVYGVKGAGTPAVSLFQLAREVGALRVERDHARRQAEESDGMARRALRQADELAGRLRDVQADYEVLRDRLDRQTSTEG